MDNPKVRMILCDVDGTLLEKGQSFVSEKVFETIRSAVLGGARFVVASGRSYPNLKLLFAPVANIISFICCDGTLAVQGDSVLYSATFKTELVSTVLQKIQLSEKESLVLYGKEHTYCFGKNSELKTAVPVTTLDDVSGQIYKLSFYALLNQTKQKMRSLAARSGSLSEIYADPMWTEFVPFGIDKGSAAAALQLKWNITPNETAAFGDNTNDVGMLRRARLSFASPAAIPDIIRMCKYQTKSVTDEILNLLQERGI